MAPATPPAPSPVLVDPTAPAPDESSPVRLLATVLALLVLVPIAVVVAWPRQAESAEPAAGAWDVAALTPVAAEVRPGGVPLDVVVETTVLDLRRFWSEQAPLLWGEPWQPVGDVVAYLPSTGTFPHCGSGLDEVEEAQMQAYYCAAIDTVAWDGEELFPAIHGWFGEAAPAVVIAHEWAHVVQDRMGAEQTTIISELQADCLAGAWLADAPPPVAELGEDFLDRAASFFAWIGDPADTHVPIDERHGTGGERLRSFGTGYREGPVSCLDAVR